MSFANEPVLELRRAPVRESLLEALRELDARLPLSVPVLVGGERGSAEGLDSTDPGKPDRVVARAGGARRRPMRAPRWRPLRRGFGSGRRARPPERAAVAARPRRGAARAPARAGGARGRECAKPWAEADADVCEAIDFLEYYARGAVELEAGRELIQVPGERNTMRYVAARRGGGDRAVELPAGDPGGMTAAALATGNAVVLKPAEQSPASAGALVEALHDAGVPPDALALLPGYGEAGAALVRIRGVHTIAFTGSSAVGLEIVRAAAETPDGQRHVKRVVAEMGGKNCVIVDSDADLDEAVPAIVDSAFVYAGQKCSAASRVLVHEAIADALLERLAGAIEVLVVGQADALRHRGAAGHRARGAGARAALRAAGRPAGRWRPRAAPVPGDGWFCPPTVAADLPEDSPVLREEIFGPLLAVERVPTVDAACDAVDALPFALTGGLFSRNPVGRRARRAPLSGGQPLRQPRDHRRHGRPPAVRRQPPVGHGRQGRRARLPAAVRRAARRHREHGAPRARDVIAPSARLLQA